MFPECRCPYSTRGSPNWTPLRFFYRRCSGCFSSEKIYRALESATIVLLTGCRRSRLPPIYGQTIPTIGWGLKLSEKLHRTPSSRTVTSLNVMDLVRGTMGLTVRLS